MLLLFVCAVVQPTLYDVPNQGNRWPNPVLVVTRSVFVGIGVRKLEDGSSWLLRCTFELTVDLKEPSAAATRVSLICGSSRSALRSGLLSTASRTASSIVRRSVRGAAAAGLVCAEALTATPTVSRRSSVV